MTTPAKTVTGLFLALGLCTIPACGGSEKKDETADKGKTEGDKKDGDKTDAATKDDGKKEAGTEVKTDGENPPPTADTTAPVPAGSLPANANEPGPAYLSLDEKGIIRLNTDGTWTAMTSAPKFVREFMIGPDGSVYLLTFGELYKIDGDNFTKVLEFKYDEVGSVNKFAFGKDGSYWVTSSNGVGQYANNAWTMTKETDIGPDVKMLNGIALLADGTPWVASSNDLHYRGADGKWAKADSSGLDRMPYFNALVNTPDGAVFAQASDYLGRITAPDKIEKIQIKSSKSYLSFYNIAISSNGHIALANSTCDVARLDPANPGTTWFKNGDDNYGCESLNGIGIDSSDRVWVTSRAGVNVLGPGDENKAYPSGSVLEIVGTIRQLIVVGKGPTLPEPGPVRKGGVTGKLLLDGAAVANANVEMCPYAAIFVKTTPCADSKVKFSGTSDASGNFTFNDVPLGNYTIAVEVNGKWQTTWASDFGASMKEGSVYDIGSLKLTAPN